MKAISICQPWAWAVVSGLKRHENRTWATAYRGPLLIHVSRSSRYIGLHTLDEWEEMMPGVGDPTALAVGLILGRVEVVDCLPFEACRDAPFATGPWCHVYENAVRFKKPMAWRGAQGLFDVPDNVAANFK